MILKLLFVLFVAVCGYLWFKLSHERHANVALNAEIKRLRVMLRGSR